MSLSKDRSNRIMRVPQASEFILAGLQISKSLSLERERITPISTSTSISILTLTQKPNMHDCYILFVIFAFWQRIKEDHYGYIGQGEKNARD